MTESKSTAKKNVFMKLKQYKPNFENDAVAKLIDAAKVEISKISKVIL